MNVIEWVSNEFDSILHISSVGRLSYSTVTYKTHANISKFPQKNVKVWLLLHYLRSNFTIKQN